MNHYFLAVAYCQPQNATNPTDPAKFDHELESFTAKPVRMLYPNTALYPASSTASPRFNLLKVLAPSLDLSAASFSTRHEPAASRNPGAHVCFSSNAVDVIDSPVKITSGA